MFIFLCVVKSNTNYAQQVKGMYVDHFGTAILGVDWSGTGSYDREDDLLEYVRVHNYNYLMLYDMQFYTFLISSKNSTTQAAAREADLERFIHKAKSPPYNLKIGVNQAVNWVVDFITIFEKTSPLS